MVGYSYSVHFEEGGCWWDSPLVYILKKGVDGEIHLLNTEQGSYARLTL